MVANMASDLAGPDQKVAIYRPTTPYELLAFFAALALKLLFSFAT
jgi:hypothetical protein